MEAKEQAEASCCRMNQTMERLRQMDPRNYSTLLRVLCGLESPTPVSVASKGYESEIGPVEWTDLTLNESQKNAVIFALVSKEIALIHGPPGVSFHSLFIVSEKAYWFRQAKRIHLLSLFSSLFCGIFAFWSVAHQIYQLITS